MRQSSRLLAASALAALLASPAGGAESPFDPGLRRLAEILGSLHFLSRLCGKADENWRGEMEKLLDAETPSPERRARFVASFNRGYDAFAGTYRACTPSAHAAMTLYVEEGATLSARLTERYGN